MRLINILVSATASAVLSAGVSLLLVFTLLNIAGAPYFAVASNSMSPVMQRGDLIVTSARGELRIGDAVTFRKHGQLITHRLVAYGKRPHTFETRGDANPGNDPWSISASDVVGKVHSVITRGGWPLLLLESGSGRIGLVAALLAALVALLWAWPGAAYSQAVP